MHYPKNQVKSKGLLVKSNLSFRFGRVRGGGPMCTLKQSKDLHFYPLNYSAFISHRVHFTAMLNKKIYTYCFNAQKFNSLDCIKVDCIANC